MYSLGVWNQNSNLMYESVLDWVDLEKQEQAQSSSKSSEIYAN